MSTERRGKTIILLGVVLAFLIAPAVGVFFILTAHAPVKQLADDAVVQQGSATAATKGTPVTVLAFSHHESKTTVTRSGSSRAATSCRVTSPDGTGTTLSQTDETSISTGGSEFAAFGEFTPVESGAYAVDCASGPALVIDSAQLEDLHAHATTRTLIGVGAAILAFVPGLIVIGVGLVRVGRSRGDRRAAALMAQAPSGRPQR